MKKMKTMMKNMNNSFCLNLKDSGIKTIPKTIFIIRVKSYQVIEVTKIGYPKYK